MKGNFLFFIIIHHSSFTILQNIKLAQHTEGSQFVVLSGIFKKAAILINIKYLNKINSFIPVIKGDKRGGTRSHFVIIYNNKASGKNTNTNNAVEIRETLKKTPPENHQMALYESLSAADL
jgi:hypothetical protein